MTISFVQSKDEQQLIGQLSQIFLMVKEPVVKQRTALHQVKISKTNTLKRREGNSAFLSFSLH